MTYKNLIHRYKIWEANLGLLRRIKPRHMYKITVKTKIKDGITVIVEGGPAPIGYFIGVPFRYNLTEMSFHVVVSPSHPYYKGLPGMPDKADIIEIPYANLRTCYNIEPISIENLPLHMFKGMTITPMCEKILKGKYKLKE